MKTATWIVILAIIVLGAVWYYKAGTTGPTDSALPIAQETESADYPAVSAEITEAASPTPKKVTNAMHLITITTNKGVIKFKTYDADAPKTVENFITLAAKKFYDGLTFHRIVKGFVIQGGDPAGNGTGGPGYSFADELNPATDSYKEGYVKGVVAMANAGPNTNGSQFFIMLETNPLPNNYTIFGKVVEGQDVVDAIGKLDPSREKIVMQNVTVSEL